MELRGVTFACSAVVLSVERSSQTTMRFTPSTRMYSMCSTRYGSSFCTCAQASGGNQAFETGKGP